MRGSATGVEVHARLAGAGAGAASVLLTGVPGVLLGVLLGWLARWLGWMRL